MKSIRHTIADIQVFRKNFKNFVSENTTFLNKPESIKANKIIFGDVVSFKSCLIDQKPMSTNPYVCYANGFMCSQNQGFYNYSSQIIFKIGTIDLDEVELDMISSLKTFNNNK